MTISAIHAVYFSATYTTRKIVREIARQTNREFVEHDITQKTLEGDVLIPKDGLLIVGVPVYAGRVPSMASERLKKLKGDSTPAIIVCVYGNRDYDDALLELHDTVVENGFIPVSAAAFIAQHSIFPTVGTQRPDEKDLADIRAFADKSLQCLQSAANIDSLSSLPIKGNKPYKTPGKVPLLPKGNRRCDKCGTCVRLCPVQAIPHDAPRTTDKNKCIICGRCIAVCPQRSRHFGGLLFSIAKKKFTKANALRKEPDTFVAG